MARREKSFWQRMVKTITVLTVVAMTVALFAQQGLAVGGDHLLWQKTGQKTLFWVLNSNGSLKNTTINDGWNNIGNAGTGWYASGLHANGARNNLDQMLMLNTANGKTVYWQLNSNGTLKNLTQTDGWGLIHPQNVATAWRISGVLTNYNAAGDDALQMFNTSNRKAAYWVLNSNGSLKNTTQNDGWGNTSTAMGAGWFIANKMWNVDADNTWRLILQNSVNGKVVYWKLNSNGTLKNTTLSDGWGNIGTTTTAWRMVQIQANGDKLGNSHMVWQNTANGKVIYWKLNSNGTLKNLTSTDGWNVIGTTNVNWVARKVQVNGSTDGTIATDHLLFNNAVNGKTTYWRLNSNGTLKNTTVTDGWNYINSATQGTVFRMTDVQTQTNLGGMQ